MIKTFKTFIAEASSEEYHAWIKKPDNSEKKLDELRKHHDHSKLEQDEKFGILSYTRHSEDLNRAHARHNVEETQHKKTTERLDKVLYRHKTPSSLHVYSGMGPMRAHVVKKAAESGKHLHLPAYTSTSTSKYVSSIFTRSDHENGKRNEHLLHVHLPKGHPGLYIDKNGASPDEKEFLLPRNTKLKIHPKPTVFETDTHTHHIWHATPVKE